MHKRAAFTLVELSIVLVILGLLVGGVLAGQSLIRAAELRAIVTEKDKFTVSINAFRDKYFALPGDMKNAFAFWGTDCGTDTTDGNTGCNGNGNGFIDYAVSSDFGENLKAWEHLSRAGLIEGNYDGIGSNNSGSMDANSSLPKSKFADGFWDIMQGDGTDYNFDTTGIGTHPARALYLVLGVPFDDIFIGPSASLTHGEAWNLDTKIDDGKGSNGNVYGFSGCVDMANDPYRIIDAGADYASDCGLIFLHH